MQKAKDRYHNRAEYYTENKDVLRENAKNEFRSLFEEKKEQKENMEEIDVETWQKIKRTSWKCIKQNTK